MPVPVPMNTVPIMVMGAVLPWVWGGFGQTHGYPMGFNRYDINNIIIINKSKYNKEPPPTCDCE